MLHRFHRLSSAARWIQFRIPSSCSSFSFIRHMSSLSSPAQQEEEMTTTLLIDGSNIAVRSFFAVKGLSSASMPTNVIQGYMNTLIMLQRKFEVDSRRVVHFFDVEREHCHRHDLFPSYKAGRSSLDEEYYAQLPVLKDALSAMGQPILESTAYEADDLIASYVKSYGNARNRILIVSSDKDLMQVINTEQNVYQVFPHKKPVEHNVWGDEQVFDNLSVRPNQIVEYLALMGDAADNVPGIGGVGAKTAAKWLTEHGNIAGILEAAKRGELKPKRFNEELQTSACSELLARNVELITLIHDLQIEDAAAAASNVTDEFSEDGFWSGEVDENAVTDVAWKYNSKGLTAPRLFAELKMFKVMRHVQEIRNKEQQKDGEF